MLSKSLIQFSLDGQGCIPSLLFDLSPNYDGGNEDNANSFKRPQACTSGLSAPDPEAGHHQPTLPHTILDTHEQVWVSLMFGHCFFLLCPGVHKVLLPPKSPSPQSCVSSGSCVMGLMATSSKRAYAIPKSAAPSSSLLLPESLPLWQSTADLYLHKRHSNTVLSQSLWSLWVLVHTRFVGVH